MFCGILMCFSNGNFISTNFQELLSTNQVKQSNKQNNSVHYMYVLNTVMFSHTSSLSCAQSRRYCLAYICDLLMLACRGRYKVLMANTWVRLLPGSNKVWYIYIQLQAEPNVSPLFTLWHVFAVCCYASRGEATQMQAKRTKLDLITRCFSAHRQHIDLWS